MPSTDFTTEELEQEIWKPIPGWPDYEASNLGRIRSWKHSHHSGRRDTPHVLSPITEPCQNQRQRVVLYRNHKRFNARVHHLILSAFVGPRPLGLLALHNDDDRSNNRLTNLRYGTQQDNRDDCLKNGNEIRGERHWATPLTEKDVIAIRSIYAEGYSSASIAERFGVSAITIRHIAIGRSWPHVGGPITRVGRGTYRHRIPLPEDLNDR